MSGSNPLVSVVIPTYDRTEVVRAVDSVRRQTYEPIELIVVDDCSQTPAADRLGRRDGVERFECIRHEENRGGNAARVTGIEAATGEYVAFLDDDDEWAPEKVERQVQALRSSAAAVAYTGVRNVDSERRTLSLRTRRVEGDVSERLLYGNFVGTFSCVMVSADAIRRIGFPDERLPCWQDWEYYLRLSEDHEFVAIPEPLVIRHNASTGQISRSFVEKRETAYPHLRGTIERIAAPKGRLVRRKALAALDQQLGYAALANGEYADARRYLLRSVARYPLRPKVYPYLLGALGGKRVYPTLRRRKRALVDRLS
ncbi:glycosyltransferase family 2 protein [Halalkalicoccus tibetensis]|uniref:Glycosyltransferase family 2 protein n=1 Tax=Halalkalicoccus tibetensis TaxID=175632 RepID=A0ABD5V7T3_9EURY